MGDFALWEAEYQAWAQAQRIEFERTQQTLFEATHVEP